MKVKITGSTIDITYNARTQNRETALKRATKKHFGKECYLHQNYSLPQGYGSLLICEPKKHECNVIKNNVYVEFSA